MNECRQFRLTLIWTIIILFIFFSGKIYDEKVELHWYISVYVYIHNHVWVFIKTLKLINLFSGLLERQAAAIPEATENEELEIYSGIPMTQLWDHFFLSFFWLAHLKQIYWFFFLTSEKKKKQIPNLPVKHFDLEEISICYHRICHLPLSHHLHI